MALVKINSKINYNMEHGSEANEYNLTWWEVWYWQAIMISANKKSDLSNQRVDKLKKFIFCYHKVIISSWDYSWA